MTTQAVLYLRSSKDRSDISPDAQRRELQALAARRGVVIVGEYVDVVLSGQDDNRPGFQRLNADLVARNRPWREILMLDTARLARNLHLAVVFEHEANMRGVRLVFAKLPEVDPINDVVLKSVVRAFDQVHSMQSRQKGLAGMQENVKQGWRAGGRAPFGYDLDVIATGAVRDGEPVTKSRLKPNQDAPRIAAFLKGRAAGQGAAQLARQHGIPLGLSSLVGVEWNALTYAGHTVWNVHNERKVDGYKTGRKRRPRSEWVIQQDTHPALITTQEAEAILALREAGRRTYHTASEYLLAGLLFTPDGKAWHGNAGYYRAGRKNIKADRLEAVVLRQVAQDLASPAFTRAMIARAKSALAPVGADAQLQALRRELAALDGKISRLVDLAADSTAATAYTRKIEEMESARAQLVARLEHETQTARTVHVLQQVSEQDVQRLLQRIGQDLATMDRDALKTFLRRTVRAELCPATLACDLHYQIQAGGQQATGHLVASPRQADENPTLQAASRFQVPRLRKAA